MWQAFQCLQAFGKPSKSPQLFRSQRVKSPPQFFCNLAAYFSVVLFLLFTSLPVAVQFAIADQEWQPRQERECVLHRLQEQ